MVLAAFRNAMHREPVIVWSFIIGGTGIVLPLVGPPIREALGYGRPPLPTPPPFKELHDKLKA